MSLPVYNGFYGFNKVDSFGFSRVLHVAAAASKGAHTESVMVATEKGKLLKQVQGQVQNQCASDIKFILILHP